jgi:talin
MNVSRPTNFDDQKRCNMIFLANWLNPEKCLSEQGVTDVEIIILKKKFFFSDQNVDRNDPIQLNLLYVQSRDAIISGKHPCTEEESAQFAAMQCQAQYGNHDPEKHKPGFIPLKDFLPFEYRKKKEVEKKIYSEHRKLQGMTELNAKYRYVQLCRSLKTYGVTFFQVREKVPKKNKYVPVLLGVTRESVIRVDPETKEVLKTWGLTTLRRWAATPSK